MLTADSTLYLSSIIQNYYQKNFWDSLRPGATGGAKFVLDLSLRFRPSAFISRNGEWSLPWKQQEIGRAHV